MSAGAVVGAGGRVGCPVGLASRRTAAATAGDRDAGRDGLLGRADAPGPMRWRRRIFSTVVPWTAAAAGRPQGREQQRRLAQVGPAAFVPARPVGPRRDLLERGDERGRVGRPVAGLLGHPGGHQRPQRLGYRVDRHRLGHVLVHQRRGGIPAERRPPGQALEKRGRGRVHIPGRAGRARRRTAPAAHTPACPPAPTGPRPGPRSRNRSACSPRPRPPARCPACNPGAPPRARAPRPGPAASPAAPPAPPPAWSRPAGPGSAAARPRPPAPSRSPPPTATRRTHTAGPRAGHPSRPAPPPRRGTSPRTAHQPADPGAGT